jgi:hypothetical protein
MIDRFDNVHDGRVEVLSWISNQVT